MEEEVKTEHTEETHVEDGGEETKPSDDGSIPRKELEQMLKTQREDLEKGFSERVKEVEDSSDPNWRIARKRMKNMEEALKGKGVDIDEEGNAKAEAVAIDMDTVVEKARSAARLELLGNSLSTELAQFEPETAKVVKHYFEKITVGEDVNMENIATYVKQAEQAASVGNKISKVSQAASMHGGVPRTPEEGGLDDERKKELGGKLGLRSSQQK